MLYKILAIADLHWGVMDDYKMYLQYQYILDYIRSNPLDMIVIAGDYFDSKLYLNSKRAIRSLDWFDELFKLAKSTGVQKVRMIRGTLSHDADQMDVFKKYEDEDFYFRVIEKCFSEETLEGLRCIYCPDEIMTTKSYVMSYADHLLSNIDIGFFHGSFDVVLRQDIDISNLMIEEESTDMNIVTSITFPMNYFLKLAKYCWVGGHWHDGNEYERIYYVGSPTRWMHGENNPKGIGVITINTDTEEYDYEKILNPICPQYITHEIRPDNITNPDEYMEEMECLIQDIIADIKGFRLKRLDYNVRIVVYETEKSVISQNVIRVLKDSFVDDDNVVIRIKSKDTKKKKKEEKEEEKKDFSFIKDKSLSMAKQIYEYIKLKNGEEVPLDYIEKMVNKFSV